MGLEIGTYINELIATNPLPSDPKSQGDDHIQLLKSTIKASFPNITGPMTATHTDINGFDGRLTTLETPTHPRASQQVFTTSGTWTRPSGVVTIMVEMVGGGGQGGGSRTTGRLGGSGGGSGAYSRSIIDVTSTASQAFTIGDGGTSGTGSTDGEDGDDTVWDTITAGGGAGGEYGKVTAFSGGLGGTATGGDFNCYGGDGGTGSARDPLSGHGGASFFGGGGSGATTDDNDELAGTDGRAYGSGGGGGCNDENAAAPGGAGADGVIIVTEYRG